MGLPDRFLQPLLSVDARDPPRLQGGIAVFRQEPGQVPRDLRPTNSRDPLCESALDLDVVLAFDLDVVLAFDLRSLDVALDLALTDSLTPHPQSKTTCDVRITKMFLWQPEVKQD